MSNPLPRWLDKVNFVKFFFVNGCDVPMVVYVETALPATGNLILNLLAFEFDDVIRGFFKPKGLRSGRHGRKKRRGKRGGGIPEIGEMVGSHLPGADEVKGRSFEDGYKKMWLLDGVLQRGLLYWMIADLAADWLADMAWGIMTSSDAYCPTIARAAAQSTGQAVTGAIFWNPYSSLVEQYAHNGAEYPAGPIVSFPAGDFVVVTTAEWENVSSGPSQVWLRHKRTAGGEDASDYATRLTLGPGQTGQMIATSYIRGPGVLPMEVSRQGGISVITGGYSICMQVG